MENPHPLRNFRLASFAFVLDPIDTLRLPEYKGATFRGGFGYAFKKVVCALRTKECGECLLREKCIYSYVFETPPPADSRMMRKYPAAPHPFVLLPPLEDDRMYEPGERLEFRLTLIGKAVDYLPYFVYTFEELGKMGLGTGRGKFRLEGVKAVGAGKRGEGKSEGSGEKGGGEKIYSAEDRTLRRPDFSSLSFAVSSSLIPSPLSLLFLTPTRLKFQGELTSDLDFHVLLRNLLRRISLLSYFHCGEELNLDFRGLIEQAEKVQTKESRLYWNDWERYSTRREEKMKLGGFMGTIAFSGDFELFAPYLLLGEWIHAGKGSSFGLGKYEILTKG